MKDSLLIFKLYRWSYDLKKMPNSWITLIIGFILTPIFIILRPLSMLPGLILPGYNSNSLGDLPVSIMLIIFLLGLIITPIHLITGASLFKNQELTDVLIGYSFTMLSGIIFISFHYCLF